jgi:hypothetical protein
LFLTSSAILFHKQSKYYIFYVHFSTSKTCTIFFSNKTFVYYSHYFLMLTIDGYRVTGQIMQVLPQHIDLCLTDTKLTTSSHHRKAFPDKLLDSIAAEPISFSSCTSSAQGPQPCSAPSSSRSLPETYIGDPEGSPYSRVLRSPILMPRTTSAPQSAMRTTLSPEDHIARTEGIWSTVSSHPLPLSPGAISPVKTGLSNQPAPKVEMSLVTGEWEKGRLIGSGTVGCVYEATNRYGSGTGISLRLLLHVKF